MYVDTDENVADMLTEALSCCEKWKPFLSILLHHDS